MESEEHQVFDEGDRVEVVNENSARYGERGTVKTHDADGEPYESIVVEFDSDGRRVSYGDNGSIEFAPFEFGEAVKAFFRSIKSVFKDKD